MMEPRLRNQLGELESALRRARLWRRLALCWLGAAAIYILLFLVHKLTGWNSRLIWALPLLGGGSVATIFWMIESRQLENFHAVIAALEHDYPELRHLLSTAAEQQPNPDSGD